MTLLELAMRVEALDGPDWKVDDAIVDLVRERGWPLSCYEGKPINYDTRLWQERHDFCPTASIDAAMQLVPEGAGFNLDRYWLKDGVGWMVAISTGGVPGNPRRIYDCEDATTAPLAITAAALRARAAMETNDG